MKILHKCALSSKLDILRLGFEGKIIKRLKFPFHKMVTFYLLLMAVYHLYAQFISRSKGHSATGASAYRAGEKIRDETNNKTHDYTKRDGVIYTEIYAPDYAPEWATDRARLWNEVEKAETNKDGSIRKKAQLAQEVRVALPRELNHEENKKLVEEYVNQQFVSRGMVADMAIHESEAGDGGKNPHAHILLTMRDISEDGFGNKNRDWNDGRAGMRKKQLNEMRESWATVQNRHLENVKSQERVDHRSYEAQEIRAVPTVHLGKEATALKRKGLESRRGNKNREVEEENKQLWARIKETTAAVWQKTKDLLSRRYETEPPQPDQPERAATDRRQGMDIFERLTGRATVSQEEAERQRREREKDREMERG